MLWFPYSNNLQCSVMSIWQNIEIERLYRATKRITRVDHLEITVISAVTAHFGKAKHFYFIAPTDN